MDEPEEPVSFTQREQLFVNDRVLKIIDLLAADARSKAGSNLRWVETEDRDAYATDFDDYTICISYVFDSFSRDMFRLLVYREGELIEAISDSRLTKTATRKLQEIYERARHRVLQLSDHPDSEVVDVEVREDRE